MSWRAMGQRLAKREVEEGVRLYHQQNHEAAIRKWRSALYRMGNPTDRFTTLGYLASAECDLARYRDMLAYAVQQIDLANTANNSHMHAEAYLNLARSNEHLSEYHKAISYCRHSLQHKPRDPIVHGYVYLCRAKAYFGFSNFSKVLENSEEAMRIARESIDKSLEMQVYSVLGQTYMCLKDFDKGLAYHSRASKLAESFKICDLSTKNQRLALLNLALPYRKLGREAEAIECCEDALKMAVAEGDRSVQARCLYQLADIHRQRDDAQRAYALYEAALKILLDTGDRYGQMEVLVGMAKTLVLMKHMANVCECKGLELNSRALDVAQAIGNKMQVLRCHLRMADLYRSLADFDMAQEEMRRSYQIETAMDIHCGVCGLALGSRPDKLESLSCFHIVHARCLQHIKRSSGASKCRTCPKCRSNDSSTGNAVAL